jgi:hypothetical protein
VFVLVISPPTAELAIPLVSCTFEEVFTAEAEIVNVTVASTPFEIAVLFSPYKIHVEVPATVLLQASDFPAAVAALPTATLMPEKLDAE